MSSSSSWTIENREGRGRCAVTTRLIPAGDIIIEEESYAAASCSEFSQVICQTCGRMCADGTVYTLSEADAYRYCSEKCITDDYAVHNHEISALTDRGKVIKASQTQSQNAKSGNRESDISRLDTPIKLIVRILAQRRIESMKASRSTTNTEAASTITTTISTPRIGKLNSFDTIKTLEAANRLLDAETKADIQTLASRLAVILRMHQLVPNSSSPKQTASEVEYLYYMIKSNAHHILDASYRPIMLGLFPMTSMINHSCVPNCAHYFVFENGRTPRLVMRAVKDVSIGEEICYSYVPLYQSTSARQQQLQGAYSFACSCTRCVLNQGRDATDVGICKVTNSPSLELSMADSVIDLITEQNRASVQRVIAALNACADVTVGVTSRHVESCWNSLVSTVRSVLLSLSPESSSKPNDNAGISSTGVKVMSALGLVHPCHKSMMQAYATILRVFVNNISHTLTTALGETGNTKLVEEQCQIAYTALGYGLLAVGCINMFSPEVSYECAALMRLLADTSNFIHRHVSSDSVDIVTDITTRAIKTSDAVDCVDSMEERLATTDLGTNPSESTVAAALVQLVINRNCFGIDITNTLRGNESEQGRLLKHIIKSAALHLKEGALGERDRVVSHSTSVSVWAELFSLNSKRMIAICRGER